jgi:5-dehydro-2-deoxygluconokinase
MDLAPEPAGSGIDLATTFSASLGGSAANIAVGIAKLGHRSALLSTVSADPVGDFCLNQLGNFGVDTRYVRKTGGELRTSLALTEARIANHRTVIYRNDAADFDITNEHAASADLGTFSSLIVTGTALAAEPSRSSVIELMKRAGLEDLQVVFDLDYRPYSWASSGEAAEILTRASRLSSVVVGNNEEFDVLAGTKKTGLDFARHLSKSDGRIVVYKRGPDGLTAFSGEDEFEIGVWPTKPLKPTGAGDSFLAAFLIALNSGSKARDAALRGAAAAALVVSRPGCAPAMPTPKELDRFMAENRNPNQENGNAYSTT